MTDMRLHKSLLPLTRFQFRNLVRNKIAFFFNLIMPLVLLAVFGAVFSPPKQPGSVAVGFVDHDGGPVAALAPDAQPLATAASANPFEHLLPGQLAYALLSAGLMTVGIALASQRHAGTLRHLFSTPLSIGLYTGTRMLANVVMALVQMVVLYGAAILLFDVHLPPNVVGTLVLLVLGAAATVGMGMAVGTLTQNTEQAFPLAMSLYMIMAFLGGAMMPIEDAPAFVQSLSRFIPVTYLTHSLKVVMIQGKSLGSVWVDLLVLAGCAVGLTGLAMWRLRRQFITA